MYSPSTGDSGKVSPGAEGEGRAAAAAGHSADSGRFLPAAAAVFLGGALLLTGPAWLWLFRRWLDGQYLPGVLALAAVAARLAFWLRAPGTALGRPGGGGSDGVDLVVGGALVVAGGLGGWIASVVESSVLLGWCFPVLALGLCLQWFGRARCRSVAPLAGYAFLIFPLPGVAAAALSLPIRLVAAHMAAWIVRGLGIDCIQQGVVLETLRYRATVVPACGGGEVIHLFLVVGIGLAYFQQGYRLTARFWLQTVLAAPAALAANAVRIAALTVVGHRWGEAAAAGFFHQFSGLLVFAVFLVLMIVAGELLAWGRKPKPGGRRAGTEREEENGAGGADRGSGKESAPAAGAGMRRQYPGTARRVLAGAVLAEALFLGGVGGWNAASRVRAARRIWGSELNGLIPEELPGWQWRTLLLSLGEESYLSHNYVIKRLYENGRVRLILFAITGAEGRRQAFHSPAICYRGDGWEIVETKNGLWAPPGHSGGRPVPYNLIIAKKDGQTATTIFWLDDGRRRTSAMVVKGLGEIFYRLTHPLHYRQRWALIAITSLNPDPKRAVGECLELAHALP